MIEYSKENRFPFYTQDKKVSVQFDNQEDMYELDFIYGKIVQKFPLLRAENFYTRLYQIQKTKASGQVKLMKDACDKLLKNIRDCISDEQFVHEMHDSYGFGIEKLISTFYAVYGYYFYTGKRTANVIKKTIDEYKRKPVY